MATRRIDGPGLAKLETLDAAMTHLQRVNAIVERMAAAARIQQSTAPFKQQIVRAATPMVGLLKAQFDQISEHVTHMIVLTSRGATESVRVRSMREAVAQIRTQIESAAARTRQIHAVKDDEDVSGGEAG
ncbi:MAG TPA: hypothetical protein VLE53_01970 [Gemmatimonadaceae bacterium]|nr:hypothetical protein [Gemmatimonadaceae bacterium]